MAIYTPGEKYRNYKVLKRRDKRKRNVVAVLSLTAMVDMFTVLVIFLLQNYNTVLYIPPEVQLPEAEKIKDLKPAVIVTISSKELLLDRTRVMSFEQVKAQQDWMLPPLFLGMQEALKNSKKKFDEDLSRNIQKVVKASDSPQDETPWNKVTIQADKGIDFLSVKKIMYTIIEAGAGEVNFAVLKNKPPQ